MINYQGFPPPPLEIALINLVYAGKSKLLVVNHDQVNRPWLCPVKDIVEPSAQLLPPWKNNNSKTFTPIMYACKP